MAEVYGNVNVKYNPCKSIAQLKSAADYILGKRKEQIEAGIEKTSNELYNAFGCNRDNFANSLIITRKMHQKKYSRYKPKEILAQKISISIHPEDCNKLSYREAYKMAEQFAQEFFWSKGYEVLFAVHTDTDHIHAHFLVSNYNQKDGTSFRRGPMELVEMSKYFGEQCMEYRLTNSVRDSFYSPNKDREEITFAEHQRTESEIEESKLTVDDYSDWEDQHAEDKSVYQAFDEFMERENIPENDESVFYGGAFQDFHREWQGIPEEKKEEPIDYVKIPMQDRAHLLPPPTDNTMEEFEKYKVRMGYNEGKMKSVRYQMSVYEDFLKEYDYRKKVKGVQRTEQKQKTAKKKRDYCR